MKNKLKALLMGLFIVSMILGLHSTVYAADIVPENPLTIPKISSLKVGEKEIEISFTPVNEAETYSIIFYKTGTDKKVSAFEAKASKIKLNNSKYQLQQGNYYDVEVTATRKDEVQKSQRKKFAVPFSQVEGLKASNISESANKITWNSISAAKEYEVWYSKSKNGKYKLLKTVSSTSYEHKKLKLGTTYYYKVFAKNADIVGKNSKTVHSLVTLKKVTGVKLKALKSGQMKLTWNGNKKATGYTVYRAVAKKKTSSLKYKKYKTFSKKDTLKLIDCVKSNKYYSYKIVANKEKLKGQEAVISKQSLKISRKTWTTVVAGDSLMGALSPAEYNAITDIKISGTKKVVAYKGLNTLTFQTKSLSRFGNKTGLDRVISYKPNRLYLMLGMNEYGWRRWSDTFRYYEEIIEAIKYESPKTQIILLCVSPVTPKAIRNEPGLRKWKSFNTELKKFAEDQDVIYCDSYLSKFLNKNGYLVEAYSSGGGVHWPRSGYRVFGDCMTKYDNALERY